jgi:hypothetical protein
MGLFADYEDMHFRIGNQTIHYGEMVQTVDQWVWDNVPSAGGVYAATSCEVDYFLGGYVSEEMGAVANWRSGEVSLYFFSTGVGGRVGTLGFLGGDVSGGLLVLHGYSSNDGLAGWSAGSGGNIQADAFLKAGIEAGRSFEFDMRDVEGVLPIDHIPWPAFDPVTGRVPYTDNYGLSVGGNIYPNAVEGAVQAGVSYTPIVFTGRVPGGGR